jgi:hypothetical protein
VFAVSGRFNGGFFVDSGASTLEIAPALPGDWRAVDRAARIPHTEEKPMIKNLLLAALLAAPLMVHAADDKGKRTPQQEKMAACNKEAADKNLKGDERKKFMSACLSAAKKTQQEKMTACNKQAGEKNLKGDERKKFMAECLRG